MNPKSTKRIAALAGVVVLLVWAVWSYRAGGVVHLLSTGAAAADLSIETIRELVGRWGPLAPVAYVLIVIVEVLVAPIPGTILYVPGGAIFGGFVGGTLSLAGNVAGAAIACWLMRALGMRRLTEWLAGRNPARYRQLIEQRGAWVIFLLRLNPLTTSDLVSYAAGLAGVPVRHVALGTLFGMAPLCYAQAYLAQELFRILPASGWWLVGLGLAWAVVAVWVLARRTS
jgi:uncharacterized membrane protein YdjX (TVP38/TMEM64 family)